MNMAQRCLRLQLATVTELTDVKGIEHQSTGAGLADTFKRACAAKPKGHEQPASTWSSPKIQLAASGRVCLNEGTIVKLGRIPSRARRMPTSALGGFLALLLLVATALSVSHELHQSLHRGRATSGHFCLVCSFAKGQVSAAAVAVICAVLVFCCLWGVCQPGTSPFSGFDYRISPSRAPPRL